MATLRTSSCRVGAVTENEARITFVSKSIIAPIVTCSGGSVAQTVMSDRYNTGGKSIATSTITITGLAGFTDYTYTIMQGSDVINGSFKTMPSTSDNFSFMVASCDEPKATNGQNPWSVIRTLMDDKDYPLAAMFHIDDVSYIDTILVDGGDGIATTGKPQDTGLARDYAVGWANYYGLVAGGGSLHANAKFAHPDRHYVYQNLPSFMSGGDHAVEDNHCRGALVNGVPNADYHGCDRTVGGLEEVAKGEWDAFLGNANPDPLRADKWHWGTQIGCVKFALFDYSLDSEPYDSVLNTDAIGYGADQINDIMSYMSDATVDFKCFLMESPPTTFGQPWLDWHVTEAGGWKTTFDADDNLNGVNGSTFAVCGDNHALYATEYDTFWNFCAGVFGATGVVGATMESSGSISSLSGSWSGQTKFSQHGITDIGDRLLGGFWLFKVTAGVKIEATCYSATGSKFTQKPFVLNLGSTDNQWAEPRLKFS